MEQIQDRRESKSKKKLHIQVHQCCFHYLNLRFVFFSAHMLMLRKVPKWAKSYRRDEDKERGRGMMQKHNTCRLVAEGRLKDTWSPGKRQCFCLSQHDHKKKRERKKKKMAQERHHRRRFDSVARSLSPPTFTRCQTTSRTWVLLNVHSVLTFHLKHSLEKEWNEHPKFNTVFSFPLPHHAGIVQTQLPHILSVLLPSCHPESIM